MQKNLIYLGCNIGQINMTAIKLKLDMSCYLPNSYARLQIDISNHFKTVSKFGLTTYPT